MDNCPEGIVKMYGEIGIDTCVDIIADLVNRQK